MLFELGHKKQVSITSAIIFFSLLFSCKHSHQKRIIDKPNDNVSNFFINANKKIIQNEEQSIDSLLGFSNIPFIKDSTGIRIFIDYSDLNYSASDSKPVVGTAGTLFAFDTDTFHMGGVLKDGHERIVIRSHYV